MASKRGDQLTAGAGNSRLTPADPFGTALDLTVLSDSKLCAQITENFEAAELTADTVNCGGGSGSGLGFECALGARTYRLDLSGDLRFSGNFDKFAAQFLGASTVPVEQTVGEGDYLHKLTFDTTIDRHFLTVAYETSSADTIELITCFTESISLSMDSVSSYISWGASVISNAIQVDGALGVNNNADLQGLVSLDTELVLPTCSHYFLLKEILDDGTDTAPTTGANLLKITGFSFEMTSPHESIDELSNGDCGFPLSSGARTGSLTVNIRELKDNTFYDAWVAGKEYVAELRIEGNQIAAGVNRRIRLLFPKLCLIDSPGYNLTDPGINPYSLVFKIVDAKNPIAGYTLGGGFEMQLINLRSAEYLIP